MPITKAPGKSPRVLDLLGKTTPHKIGFSCLKSISTLAWGEEPLTLPLQVFSFPFWPLGPPLEHMGALKLWAIESGVRHCHRTQVRFTWNPAVST